MAFLIATPDRPCDELAALIRKRMPGIDLRIWPDIGRPDEIEFALVWKPPGGLFRQLPSLRAIVSLGAGVDAIVDDPEILPQVPIGRLAGPRLAANMAAYVVSVIVAHWKGLPGFMRDQQGRRWNPWAPEHPPLTGILGSGRMGAKTARALRALDMPVRGYSRSGRGPEGVVMHSGRQGLNEIARQCDYLVNLLPLTPQTEGILNAGLFQKMKPGSTLINVGRGRHLVEADLIPALDRNRPGSAILDVFQNEPLPDCHPFWADPRICITPHCASITLIAEAAELAVESYLRVLEGKPPLGLVDRSLGY